jgi:wyosine [tRNA(Phe)-imidazoG37] synthetase (radical SAM superfamily)
MGKGAAKLLFADAKGKVMEHPTLWATVRSGEELLSPPSDFRPLPPHGKLVHLPGRAPVGFNPETGDFELVSEVKVGGRTLKPSAVGALLPPGYTRSYLPGEVAGEGPVLPQWAYAAAAWSGGGPVVWALRTDARTHWNPDRYSTPELRDLVKTHRERFPENRVLKQLSTCALIYRCFTSQNIFYERDEGAIPASVACNARCVGCISDQPPEGPPASHQRMDDGPSSEEMAEVGAHHLIHASGRKMVSFGQGCEGEPLTRYRAVAEAISLIRARTGEGSIHINTNGSLPHAMEALLDAGLDSVRVSLNSSEKSLYEAYYQPIGYGWEEVDASLALASARGAYVALNLLTFPGVTDREGEVESLIALVKRHKVGQVQTRSLCIDPKQYLEVVSGRGAGGEPMGFGAMLSRLQREAPWVRIGNFSRGLDERDPRTS